MNHGYTYQDVLVASQRIDWRVEDLIGGDRCLDFTKPFMPESLARVEALNFLTPRRTDGAQPDPWAQLSQPVRTGRGIHPAVRARPCPAAAQQRRLPHPRAAAVRQRGGQAHPSVQKLPRRVRSWFRHELPGDRPGGGHRQSRPGARTAFGGAADPSDRVDDAEPLSWRAFTTTGIWIRCSAVC